MIKIDISKVINKNTDKRYVELFRLIDGDDIKRIEVLVIQRFGRATRKDKGTDKDIGIVIDLLDSFSPLGKKQSLRRKQIYEDELGFTVEVI
jgi:hypothetical protein